MPVTVGDHKAYYPGAQPVHVRITGDTETGRLLGVQMLGTLATGAVKRIDTAATAQAWASDSHPARSKAPGS
ncbi:MAG: hypothetical protein ACYCXA_08285 [Actinomycetes bacterium]